MTLAELARFLHMSERTVLKLAKDKKLPALQIENQWRFQRAMIEEWLQEQHTAEDEFESIDDGLFVKPLLELQRDDALPDGRVRRRQLSRPQEGAFCIADFALAWRWRDPRRHPVSGLRMIGVFWSSSS